MASGSKSTDLSKYWHGTSPKREVTDGKLKASYNDLSLKVEAEVTNKYWYSGYQSQNMKDRLYIVVDDDDKAHDDYSLPSSWSSTFTKKLSCDCTINVSAGKHSIAAYMHCSDSKCGSSAYSGYGIKIGSFDITVPNPYTAPKVEITSVTALGKKGNSSYKIQVKYNVTKGTDNLTKTYAVIYDNSNNKIEELDMNTTQTGTGKTVSFTIPNTNKYDHGTKYKVAIKITDGTSTKETSKLRFYSYTEPTLTRVTVTKTDTTSPVLATSDDTSTVAEINARTGFQFNLSGTNNAKWIEQGEKEFKTRFKTNYDNEYTSDDYDGKSGSERSVGNTIAYGLSVANTRKLFPPDHNGTVYDASTKQISFARYGSSTNWYSSWKTVKIKVYYRPRQMVTDIKFGKDSSSSNWKTGTKDSSDARKYTLTDSDRIITNPDSYTSIFVKWTYDDTTPESGFIQGYRVVLQYNSPVDGWKSYKTYYTTNKYQEIKKADIPRIYKSRVIITPYYKHNESSIDNYWYATSAYQVTADFFTIISPLATPTIEYPIHNTTWHNQDFRVCFKLPTDPDMAWLQTNEPTVANSYTYHNIEIKVDSNIYRLNDAAGYTDTGTKYVDMFSCIDSGLTYQAPVVVHTTKHYSTTASSHTIQIRVKKLLGTTSGRTMWTGWSTSRTVKINHPTYNVTAIETIIQATHYNTLYDMISNISKVYNITWSNAPTKVTARTTIVDNSQYTYNSMIKVLADIKAKINNYATFNSSKTAVKIDSTNKLTSSADWNPKERVLITAEKDKPNETWNNNYNQGKEGHNYIKWVYEQCDYLK